VAGFERDLEANLQKLRSDVLTGKYSPKPVRRFHIPKQDGV
jgi:retron-type reverse transcriptase